VVLTTDADDTEHLAQALFLGAFDWVTKPFRNGELLAVVSKAVQGGNGVSSLSTRAAAAMTEGVLVKQACLEIVWALARAVEAKDPYTRRHSEQVAHYATNLAGALGLPAAQVERIRVSALLHDIGKIGVPDHILTKRGPLTSEEFDHIRRHPALGANILGTISLFTEEARLVRHHHEWWDGRGYPDGLTGEESPLGARIIHVADAMDAMLMDRTYKQGYSVDRMICELVRCAGTQFDPRLSSAACQWCLANSSKLIFPDHGLAPIASLGGAAP
jgi:putative nucleotidyltransferase with HDIG domain